MGYTSFDDVDYGVIDLLIKNEKINRVATFSFTSSWCNFSYRVLSRQNLVYRYFTKVSCNTVTFSSVVMNAVNHHLDHSFNRLFTVYFSAPLLTIIARFNSIHMLVISINCNYAVDDLTNVAVVSKRTLMTV